MNRRNALTAFALAGLGLASTTTQALSPPGRPKGSRFLFSLNTSTIMGQKLGVKKYIDAASRAGYDAIELWMMDIKEYLGQGGSLPALKQLLSDSRLQLVDCIGFAPWMVNDSDKRKAGMMQMKDEMEILAALGCPRVAAPSFGITSADEMPDMFRVGERYEELLALGKQTGVTPLLEFWGASQFFHVGQALMAVAVANDPASKILADVYHLHRGGSGFESLKMMDGSLIEIFHMNDYPANPPREKLEDKDRIYPGDGVAPWKQILTDLKAMEGTRILSLELFNREYWAQDPLEVASTGLNKMRKLVELHT
jgi:sugar phosphate isomerase/epimerase